MVILRWAPPLFLVLSYKWDSQEKVETMRIVGKFRSSRPEIYKNSYANIPNSFRESTCGGVLF